MNIAKINVKIARLTVLPMYFVLATAVDEKSLYSIGRELIITLVFGDANRPYPTP